MTDRAADRHSPAPLLPPDSGDRLLDWFDTCRRDLPWRRDRDPYRIWVSEVMLQQTTVAAVIPYYDRFLAAFPTVSALAAADEQQVLKLWEGLGYYRRARHLHAAARRLVAEHGGTLPDDPTVWADLPGVGRYILGAVLSQAFDRRLPAVDTNSQRVLCRLFGYRGDPRRGPGRAWVWSTAATVLPPRRVGDFNQALMELGALVCTPRNPNCSRCPLRNDCRACRDGTQDLIPPARTPQPATPVREVAVVIRRGARILLCRRRADADRWQNLWEVPHAAVQPGETATAAAARIARELTGLSVEPGEPLTTLTHGVTRFRITVTVVEAVAARGRFASGFYAQAKWLSPAEWADYPTSAPQRRLLRAVTSSARQRRLF